MGRRLGKIRALKVEGKLPRGKCGAKCWVVCELGVEDRLSVCLVYRRLRFSGSNLRPPFPVPSEETLVDDPEV